MRKIFVLTICLVAAWIQPALAARHANVILIVVDTLRADHLGFMGGRRGVSPNIDALAADSVVFRHATATASWTSPAIGSMVTAQFPRTLGFKDHELIPLDPRFMNIAQVFQGAGYATGGIVSHDLVSKHHGFGRGFGYWDDHNAQGHDHVSSPDVTDKAIGFVRRHAGGPFYLFLHYFDPHYTFIMHQEFNWNPGYRGPLPDKIEIKPVWDMAAAGRLTPEDLKHLLAVYDSEISFTDRHLGRLMAELKALGIYDDTLVVLTADHGEEFVDRDDGYIGHGRSTHREMIHVPLTLKFPRSHPLAGPRTFDQRVSLVDLGPTLLASQGLGFPSDYRHAGRDLFPGGRLDKARRRAVVSETTMRVRDISVTAGEWKLLLDLNAKSARLYNLALDPDERRDLAATWPDKVRELKTAMAKWERNLERLEGPGRRSGPAPAQPRFSPEQRERLRSLGYL